MSSRQPSTTGGGITDTVVGNYRIAAEIGRGSFATVYKAHHTSQKAVVAAIKVVHRHKLNRKLLDNLESEIQILKKLHHPHIVALTDCKKTDKYIHIIMEYCSVGDLSVIIKKRERLSSVHPCLEPMIRDYPSTPGGGLHEVVARHFLKQLASALQYLRNDGLVHRDVKPQNLLLNPPADYRPTPGDEGYSIEGSMCLVGLHSLPVLKLADFGFARVLPATSMAETLCGSPLYMAPEILRYEKYDATADLWSVGTVLYEMVAGRPPFRAPNHVDLLRRIETKNDKIDFPSACVASDEIRGLVRALLKRNPLERMTFKEFFDHPVVKGDILDSGAQKMERTSSRTDIQKPARVSSFGTEAEREAKSKEGSNARREREAVESSALPFAHPSLVTGGTPPRLNDLRRATTQAYPTVPRSPIREPGERPLSRPGLMSHGTAPARHDLLPDRQGGGTPMLRTASRESNPSPGNSLLVQQRREVMRDVPRYQPQYPSLNREKRRTSKEYPDIEEDERIDKDYVVVDKQAVHINALADELATMRQGGLTPPSPSSSTALSRRPTYQLPQTRAISINSRTRTEMGNPPKSSYERRYGGSPSSARSTLARALEVANLRLFGVSVSPPSQSPPNLQNPFPPYPTHGSMVLIGNGTGLVDDDMLAVHTIEEAASRSDVVHKYAEVKYGQLLPSDRSGPRGLGLLPPTASEADLDMGEAGVNEVELTPDAVVQLAEEALVLFVKALSLLANAMDIAGAWWAASSSRSKDPTLPATTLAGTRMNNVVQWVRERFNEVLEKAEFVRLKLLEAQKELPPNHPSHPSNFSDAGLGSNAGDRVNVTPGVTAEKLMYDRALEMSRAAAVNELVGEDLNGCEAAYVTSVCMLEAVLEGEDDGGMEEEEDRKTVEKYIVNIRARLTCLRKKLVTMSKRSNTNSVHSLQISPQPPRSMSPAGLSPTDYAQAFTPAH